MENSNDFTLPPELGKILDQFSGWYTERRISPDLLGIVLDRLAGLPPASIVRADGEIATRARLYSWSRYLQDQPVSQSPIVSLLSSLIKRPASALTSEEELLAKVERLEWLFLFHRNGFMREAALAKLTGPAISPFFAAALAYRLNDWVPQVRRAAVAAIERVFPETKASILAAAAEYLLDRDLYWGRWQDEGRMLASGFARADVLECLTQRLLTAKSGAMTRLMRPAFRYPDLDRHLLDLAKFAYLPSVRVLATRALIDCRVRWQIGFEKEWVDKTMGFYRLKKAYAEREILRPLSLEDLILQGASDKSAVVRKVAATALVQNRKTLGNRDELIAFLKDDRSPSVRSAVDFVIRDLKGEVTVFSPASS
jgi:HEAT repeat protein